MDMIASAERMKTTTPMIPHSVTASSNYAFVSLFSGENLHIVPLNSLTKMRILCINKNCKRTLKI